MNKQVCCLTASINEFLCTLPPYAVAVTCSADLVDARDQRAALEHLWNSFIGSAPNEVLNPAIADRVSSYRAGVCPKLAALPFLDTTGPPTQVLYPLFDSLLIKTSQQIKSWNQALAQLAGRFGLVLISKSISKSNHPEGAFMSNSNLIPAADPVALGKSYADTVNAVGHLIELMCNDLSDAANANLVRLVEGGGRVGLEVTIDRHGSDRISLIGLENEGARHVLLSVTPPAPQVPQH